MSRRILRAFVGAALMAAMGVPANAAAPPDVTDFQTAIRNGFLCDWIPPPAEVVEPAKTQPEQKEGRINEWEPNRFISGLTPAGTLTSDLNIPIVQVVVETLPMPHEDATTQDGVTCPYLRRQMLDHHAVQIADPEVGHDVLDNLARLKEADELLELAEVLANDGCIDEAMACCERAEELCPGSPCAERAADTKLELALGIVRPTSEGEEAAEPEADEVDWWNSIWLDLFERMGLPLKKHEDTERLNQLLDQSEDLRLIQAEWERIWFTDMPSRMTPERIHGGIMPDEPGREEMVNGLMKACRLLMNQGMHHQAAELARQAFALDPQRVQADPLIYKMHLLAASSPPETTDAPEPPTCPYCGNAGKPIRDILDEPKTTKPKSTTLLVPVLPKVDYELVPALDRVLTEDAKPTAGAEEASEAKYPSTLEEMAEVIRAGWGMPPVEVESNVDGSLRLSGDCSLGDSVFHLRYTHGCLAIWKTTDAAKTPTK